MKSGAYDYISKPLIPDEVLNLLSRVTADTEIADTEDNDSQTAEIAGVPDPRKLI